jgi:hypothetical protein
VLFKIKLYKNYIYCLFIAFLIIFSMFVYNHTCVLFGTRPNYIIIVHTNVGITVKCLLSDVCYFPFFNLLFPRVELPVFGYCTFNCLNYWYVYCITRCEKIIEHTGTPVNILYNSVALVQYEYTSKEIIISLIRS